MQAVETRPPLPLLTSPFNLSLFPVTSKTFPQLPHWLHSVTQAVSSSPVMGNLCMYDRKKAKDESVTHHSRERLFALQRTLLINKGLWLQTVAIQPEKDAQENVAPLRDFWSCQSVQFMEQRLVKSWFDQTSSFPNFCMTVQVQLLS